MREEAGIEHGWKRLPDPARAIALRRRCAASFAFIRARVSPAGRFGLHLTLGALILIGAAWPFGGIGEDVVHGDPLTVVDADVAAWFHAHAVSTLTRSPELCRFDSDLDHVQLPSGHVAAATLFYGLLAAFIVTRIEAWRWQVLVALCAFLIAALVALSRVYLGAHFLSDVLAALAESIAWLALCLTAAHTLRRYPADRHQG